ncbi:molecular chaperone GrpE [Propionicimonas paludicola]|uniref:Protein GrpE n=1 Tax=Propionicimonas paludicola TaxID=185243 RepID=A0A2A9CMR1_9ACTN|nr:molecular chaperone GrpE [Propionicimonas paludicola]
MSEENTQPTPEPGEDQAPADAMDEALAELLDEAAAGDQQPASAPSETDQLKALVAERTEDLQRLHAEYANYKKRVDRDRALSRAAGIEAVILDLLPILDSIEAAREHDELVGGFRLVAEEFEKTASKYGLETFGEVGELFDPQIHEALMQLPMEGELAGPTVSAVMQRGVKLNERVIRPARVGVADPDA